MAKKRWRASPWRTANQAAAIAALAGALITGCSNTHTAARTSAGTTPSASLAATGGPTSPTVSAPARGNVNPATEMDTAWLTPAELAAATNLSWAPGSIPRRVMNAPENNLGTCISGNPRQVGAESQWQNGADIRGTAGDVYQVQYFYPDASAAHTGLAAFEALYAHCQGTGTKDYLLDPHLVDTVRVTVQADGRFAMLRTVRHPDGTAASSATVGSDSHEFLAQEGNVIYFVGLYGNPAIDDTARDAQVLGSMLDALGHYRK